MCSWYLINLFTQVIFTILVNCNSVVVVRGLFLKTPPHPIPLFLCQTLPNRPYKQGAALILKMKIKSVS